VPCNIQIFAQSGNRRSALPAVVREWAFATLAVCAEIDFPRCPPLCGSWFLPCLPLFDELLSAARAIHRRAQGCDAAGY